MNHEIRSKYCPITGRWLRFFNLNAAVLIATLAMEIPMFADTTTTVPNEKSSAIRPFHYSASESALVDLRRRILATRWPDRELVPDASQGVQLATMQKLAHYWATRI